MPLTETIGYMFLIPFNNFVPKKQKAKKKKKTLKMPNNKRLKFNQLKLEI